MLFKVTTKVVTEYPHHHNTVQFEGYEDRLRKEDVVCIADYHKDLISNACIQSLYHLFE